MKPYTLGAGVGAFCTVGNPVGLVVEKKVGEPLTLDDALWLASVTAQVTRISDWRDWHSWVRIAPAVIDGVKRIFARKRMRRAHRR